MPNANSKAAGNFFGLLNGEGPGGLQRSGLLVGQQLPAFALPLERLEVANAAQVGVLTGKGSVLHRLAIAWERGSQKSVPFAIMPQDEEAAGTAATGSLTVAGASTAKGTWGVRLNGDRDLEAQIQTISGSSAAAVATLLYNEIVKLLNSPLSAVDDTLGEITFTAKNKGTFGNFVSIEVIGDVPAGLTATVSDMSGGATDPDIDDALIATGNNQENDTALAHGQDIAGTVLNKLSAYNGDGNTFTGLYQREIGRPFRSLVSDATKSATDWDTFLDNADRKLDRTSGAMAAPALTAHPAELAASVLGIMERVNTPPLVGTGPTAYYEGEQLSWLPVPPAADRYWELGSDGGYTLRDNAVLNGLSPLIVIDGVYTLQNVNTFYHPDDVEDDENGWIDMADIALSQNILQFYRDLWSSDEWTGIIFVANKADVGTVNPDGTPVDRSKVKDRDEVVTTLIQSFKDMAAAGWLYEAQYSIDALLSDVNNVVLRINGSGFDYQTALWYRLKGYIKNGQGVFNVGGLIAQG